VLTAPAALPRPGPDLRRAPCALSAHQDELAQLRDRSRALLEAAEAQADELRAALRASRAAGPAPAPALASAGPSGGPMVLPATSSGSLAPRPSDTGSVAEGGAGGGALAALQAQVAALQREAAQYKWDGAGPAPATHRHGK
jgi:hypothetical protein